MDGFRPSEEKSNFSEEIPVNTELLDLDNHIYVEGKKVEKENLDKGLFQYFNNSNSKNKVQLFSSKKANYGIYNLLQNSINNPLLL